MPKPCYITASRIKDMMTSGRSKSKTWGDSAINYAYAVALERCGVDLVDTAFGAAIDWGHNNEYLAIQAYESARFVDVHSQQVFQQHSNYAFVGGTPDGLIGEVGGLDVKCPYNMINHGKNIINNEQLKLYNDQFQSYMWITGRVWWDFVSFDPRYPKELQLHVHRVERDDERIEQIDQRYNEFEFLVQDFVSKIKGKRL